MIYWRYKTYLHFYFSGDIMNKRIFLFIVFIIFLIILNYNNYLNDFIVITIISVFIFLEFISGILLLFSSKPVIHKKILLFYQKIYFINNDYKQAFAQNFHSMRKLFGTELILNAVFIFNMSIDFLLRLLSPNEIFQENTTGIALALELPVLIFYIFASIYISKKIKRLSIEKISDDSPWKH